MTNKEYQARFGWIPEQVAQEIGSMSHDVDNDVFRNALRNWQKKWGLHSDGFLGPRTWGVMRIVCRWPNTDDILYLARLLPSECGSPGYSQTPEIYGVAFTAINRLIEWQPRRQWNTVATAVTAFGQYARLSEFAPEWAVEYAESALRGWAEQPCPRCTHFYSPRSMPPRDAPEVSEVLEENHWYQQDGQYFCWRKGRKNWHTVGGWDEHGRGVPKWAYKMEWIPAVGTRPTWYRFYRKSGTASQ